MRIFYRKLTLYLAHFKPFETECFFISSVILMLYKQNTSCSVRDIINYSSRKEAFKTFRETPVSVKILNRMANGDTLETLNVYLSTSYSISRSLRYLVRLVTDMLT